MPLEPPRAGIIAIVEGNSRYGGAGKPANRRILMLSGFRWPFNRPGPGLPGSLRWAGDVALSVLAA